MSNSSNLDDEPPGRSRRLWLILFSRPVIGFLLVLLVILGGASWQLWRFVNQELALIIEKNLSQTFNRPVELGPIKRFSLTSVRFGKSSIPPFTKRVANTVFRDADTTTVQAVDVGFNPLNILFNRTLNLNVTLVQPNLYLDQAKDGRWLSTPITTREQAGPIKTKLQAIRFRQGEAVLVPSGMPSRRLRSVNGAVIFAKQNRQIKFDLASQVDYSGGKLDVQGVWFRPTQKVILTAKAEDLAAPALADLAPQLPIQVKAGRIDGKLRVQYQQNQPLKIAGTTRLNSVTAVVSDRYLLRSRRPTSRVFRDVNGTVQFLDQSQRIGFDLQGQVVAGGTVKAKGEWFRPTQQVNLALRTQNLAATVLDGLFKLPIRVSTGRIDSSLIIQLRRNQQASLQGNARLKNVTAQVAAIPQPFRNITGQLRFEGQGQGLTTTLEQVSARYSQIPLQASGSISPDRGYDLTGQTQPVKIAKVLDTLNVTLPFSTSGHVQGQNLRLTGAINEPLLSGVITAPGTPQIDQVAFSSLTARFQLDAPLLKFTKIRAVPVIGGVIIGKARYDFRPLGEGLVANLQARNIPGNAIAQLYGTASTFKIGSVSAQAKIFGPPGDIKTAVRFQVPEAVYPTTGEVLVRNGKTFLRNLVAQIAGGTVRARGEIVDGSWQAIVEPTEVSLQGFSSQLRGRLRGQLNLSGTLASFQPEDIRAQGQVRLSQGVSIIQQPITAQVRWNGQTILVQRATAPGFRANGTIAVGFEGPQAPQITALNLNVKAQNYPLRTLPPIGPTDVKLAGQADLTGRLTGTPTAPNLSGSFRVNNLALNQLAFEPTLTGRLSYGRSQGLDLRLAGRRDQINVALGPNLQPESFDVQRGQATATGRTQGEQLLVDLQQFPLTALNLTSGTQSNLGPVSGLASGNFAFNLRTRTLAGSIAIARPAIGRITGNRLTGNLRFANGIATLSNGVLQQGDSRFLINAKLNPGVNPQFSGQIQVASADIQDVLTALKIFEINDLEQGLKPPVYGQAADVQTVSVGLPGAPLQTQLRRLSEIEVLLAQQIVQRQQTSPLPDLADLQGKFSGQINFSGSQQAGLKAKFDLQGQDFDWGPYSIDQIVASGSFADGVVNLRPLRLTTGDSFAAFTGQVGGKQQSGQLTLNNVPTETLSDFVNLPFDIAGNLNATATLGGSFANPQLQGQLSLADATLNQAPVQTAQADFNYNNARLNFDGTAVIQEPEPIQITGSLPYKLPFASVSPVNKQVSLDVRVQNEGLALLNLFTDQVAWVNGQGEVDLRVRGTLEQPLVNGIVRVDDATLRAQALSQSFTDVTGTVRFNRDLIRVERLTGRLNQGQVVVAGVLPIFAATSPAPDQTMPLTVSLNNLDLKLKDLYNGEVDGNLVVTGTALSPEIGGAIQLEAGQVLLADTSTLQTKGSTPLKTAAGEVSASLFTPVQFNGLQVTLNNVQVTRPPLLDFLAYGDLTLNGSSNNIRPDGIIRFRRGEVNLFTTRFRLDRNDSNYALFDPNQGLDPYLNLNLQTTVTEVTGGSLTNLGDAASLPPSSLGLLESVRVEADVNGRASQLAANFRNVVELSSSPARNEDEIIALLGGGFANARGQDAGLALANIAGSAVLSNIQGAIDDALGSRVDFRLFPTLIPTESETSVLGLGAELGYDVTQKFSVSALQVLTGQEEPTQFNLNYEINDQLRARTGVSLDGEAMGIIEYRTRF